VRAAWAPFELAALEVEGWVVLVGGRRT